VADGGGPAQGVDQPHLFDGRARDFKEARAGDNQPEVAGPRKKAYLKHLKTAPPPMLLVSAADKLHNVRSIVKDFLEIDHKVWARFKGGEKGTLWYYKELVEIFKKRGEHRMPVDELARSVAKLQRLASST
jgi:hypothetical protein